MAFQLIDKQWHQAFSSLSNLARQQSLIITPFVNRQTIEDILGSNPKEVKVITRFNLDDMYDGVSDITALEYLLDIGAIVKGLKHLHAKAYIFGNSKAIITSANLTHSGLHRNAEFGVVSTDQEFIQSTTDYFTDLWRDSGPVLTRTKLKQMKDIITQRLLSSRGKPHDPPLGDFGYTKSGNGKNARTGGDGEISLFPGQAFVKFFGISSDRATRDWSVIKAIKESECQQVLSYPKNKRPRQIKDGDLIFISRLVEDPNDIMIYGRARGKEHQPDIDNASASDIKRLPWRKKWSNYVRIEQTEFVDANLGDCVSLYELEEEMGPAIFSTTYGHYLRGHGNMEPRKAYMQQAHVRLTPQGALRINEKLNDAFIRLGKISFKKLSTK